MAYIKPIELKSSNKPEAKKTSGPVSHAINLSSSISNTKIEKALEKAKVLNEPISKHPRLKPKLDQLISLPYVEQCNWATKSLDIIADCVNRTSEIQTEFASSHAIEIADLVLTHIAKVPSFIDRLVDKIGLNFNPSDYIPRLEASNNTLKLIITKINATLDVIKSRVETLLIETVALHSIAESDNTLINRVKLLMQSQQTAISTVSILENSKLTIEKHLQEIDRLLHITIPNWKLKASIIK